MADEVENPTTFTVPLHFSHNRRLREMDVEPPPAQGQGTYADITRATEPFWRSQTITVATNPSGEEGVFTRATFERLRRNVMEQERVRWQREMIEDQRRRLEHYLKTDFHAWGYVDPDLQVPEGL